MGNFLTVASFFPNIYQKSKLMIYKYDKILYYGSGNASGRMRFTTHHDPNDNVSNK